MSNSPQAAMEALRAVNGVLSLAARNVRHAIDIDNNHGGRDRLLESQARTLDVLTQEVTSMVEALAPVIESEPVAYLIAHLGADGEFDAWHMCETDVDAAQVLGIKGAGWQRYAIRKG